MMGPNYQEAPYIKDDKCLWDPKKVSAKECKYITLAKQKVL